MRQLIGKADPQYLVTYLIFINRVRPDSSPNEISNESRSQQCRDILQSWKMEKRRRVISFLLIFK